MATDNLMHVENNLGDDTANISSSVDIPDAPVFIFKSNYEALDTNKVLQFKIERGHDQNDYLVTAVRPFGEEFWYFIKNKNSKKLKKHVESIQNVIKSELSSVPRDGRVLSLYLSSNYYNLYYNKRIQRFVFDGFVLTSEKEQMKNSITAFSRQVVGRAKAAETRKKNRAEKLKKKITNDRHGSDSEDPDLADEFDYSKYLKPGKFNIRPVNRPNQQKDGSNTGDSGDNNQNRGAGDNLNLNNNSNDAEDGLSGDIDELSPPINNDRDQLDAGRNAKKSLSLNTDLQLNLIQQMQKQDYRAKNRSSLTPLSTPKYSKSVPTTLSGKKRRRSEYDNDVDNSDSDQSSCLPSSTNLTKQFEGNLNLDESNTNNQNLQKDQV